MIATLRRGVLALWLTAATLPLYAQGPAATVEVDPLTCWWRTSVSAITVGQPFTLVLTCAVVETDRARAVVDRARLDPKAIELAPFEVLGGRVAADVTADERTFFQIEYTLRFVNEGFFNQDVALPNLAVPYRIEMRGADGGAATQGMERRFALPRVSLRVTSLVPGDANDIRDATAATFADVDALASRGRLLATGGLIGLGLAAIVAIAGLGRAAGTMRWRPATTAGLLRDSAILRGARRALSTVRTRVAHAGQWTADDVADALAAARLVGTCAVGGTVSQRRAAAGESVPSGAIGVKSRFGTGRLVIASGASTAKNLSQLVPVTPRDRTRIEAVSGALTTFTAAQYQEAQPLDDVALGDALSTVAALATRLSVERLWIVERLTPWVHRRPLERRTS